MTPYIALIIMGIIVCLVMFSMKNKYRLLASIGEKADGTLVDFEYPKAKNNSPKLPVARFKTKDEQWITGKTENSLLSNNAQKNSQVIIFYNPANPEEFMIQGRNFKLMYLIVMAGGILFTVSGVLLLLNYAGILKFFK